MSVNLTLFFKMITVSLANSMVVISVQLLKLVLYAQTQTIPSSSTESAFVLTNYKNLMNMVSVNSATRLVALHVKTIIPAVVMNALIRLPISRMGFAIVQTELISMQQDIATIAKLLDAANVHPPPTVCVLNVLTVSTAP